MRSSAMGPRAARVVTCLVLSMAFPGCNDDRDEEDAPPASQAPVAPTAAAEGIVLLRCSADPVEGIAPATVRFNPDILPRGDGATFVWSFGDGATSSQPSPQHVYVAPGIYRASVTVARGGTTASCTTPAVFVYGNLTAICRSRLLGGTSVHFRVLPSFCLFDECSYGWDFGGAGGGVGLTGPRPDFTYATGGTYTATATVSTAGQTATCRETVTVP